MANFPNCRLLDTAMQCISLDRKETDPVLEEYRQILHDILYGEYDPLEAERILRENIFIFREDAAIEKEPEQARLYRFACHLTEIVLQQNRKRESAPALFSGKRPSAATPSLVWFGTKAELYELIVALYGSGVVSDVSGQQLSFARFVDVICMIFNVDGGSPMDIKRSILSRKTRLSAFIDRLQA